MKFEFVLFKTKRRWIPAFAEMTPLKSTVLYQWNQVNQGNQGSDSALFIPENFSIFVSYSARFSHY